MEQHREPGAALHERADRGTAQPEHQVSFPVARHCPVFGLGRALADQDFGGDELLAPPAGPGLWHSQRTAGAQTRGELSSQRTAALNVERLVDRLVGDPHGLIIGEVDRQPVGDLFRAPGGRPAPVLAATVPSSCPTNLRAPNRRSVRGGHLAGEPGLHVLVQLVVLSKLGRLGPPRLTLGLPLRDRRPILQLAAPRRRVAAQLTRDRRRRAPQLPGDLTHPELLGVEQCDLLALGERQVASRWWDEAER